MKEKHFGIGKEQSGWAQNRNSEIPHGKRWTKGTKLTTLSRILGLWMEVSQNRNYEKEVE